MAKNDTHPVAVTPGAMQWWRWWVTAAVLALLGLLAWSLLWEFDHAVANVVMGICMFLATLVAWITVWRSSPSSQRKWVAGIPVLLGIAAAGLLEFQGFNGEIVPQFQWRFAGSRSKPPAIPTQVPATSPQAEANPSAPPTTPASLSGIGFPQYLGVHRDGKVSSPRFSKPIGNEDLLLRWQVAVGAGWSGMALAGNRLYTIEQHGSDESVRCYATETGQLIWKHDYPAKHENLLGGVGPRSTPAVIDGQVVAAGACGDLHCLDAQTGVVRWKLNLNELAATTQKSFESTVSWGRSASPLCHEGLVYLPLGGDLAKGCQSLIAIDLESGEERWRAGDGQIAYASPALLSLDGTLQVLWLEQEFVCSCDPKTGQLLWKHPWPSSSSGDACASQPMQIDSRRLLLTKGYGQGCRVIEVGKTDSKWQANEIWSRTPLLRTKFTSALVDGDVAYGLNDGILECVDLDAGKRLWRQGRYGHGQVLLVQRKLVIVTESGELVVIAADPSKPELLARLPVLQGTTWNPLAVVGSQIYLRNAKEMARVDLQTDGDSL
ncbi:MAG: PQQ-binding-like beta-propeller repeat protein [Pirellulaceae bacterium]|jgi:outer membrane protein assembly factor BamB